MPYYRVNKTTTTVETLYVYADDADAATRQVGYGRVEKENYIDRKGNTEVTCEGEWGAEDEWTVVALADGKMVSMFVEAPSEAIARDRVETWHWNKFDIVQVFKGRIEPVKPGMVEVIKK